MAKAEKQETGLDVLSGVASDFMVTSDACVRSLSFYSLFTLSATLLLKKEARRIVEEADASSSSGITRQDFWILLLSKGCAIIGPEELPVVSRPETWLLPIPLLYPLVAFLNCLYYVYRNNQYKRLHR